MAFIPMNPAEGCEVCEAAVVTDRKVGCVDDEGKMTLHHSHSLCWDCDNYLIGSSGVDFPRGIPRCPRLVNDADRALMVIREDIVKKRARDESRVEKKNIPDRLRALADEVTDEVLNGYELGHHEALVAVTDELLQRQENNPKLASLSIDAIIAIISSHSRATKAPRSG